MRTRHLLIIGVFLSAAFAAAPSAWASTTYTVTSTADSGAGTLRQAILEANGHVGTDSIRFNLPGSGVQTIGITTALPSVTDPVIINGRSQPGFAGTPLVRVDNTAATKLNGLRIAAGNSQVLGLEFTRFGIAIRLVGDANRVQGNLIGTSAMGDAGLGNTTGVRVESGTDNRIGGIAGNAPNVISANVNYGVEIVAPATATTVSGNRIGTNPAGTAALGNGTGVRIAGGSIQNVIGGTTVAERNLISGNKNYGVRLMDAGTAHNTISGNYVGTSADGTGALSDGVGIRADTGASPNTIGGTTAGARNVVSGNASIGIQLDGAATSANTLAGNYIGTTATGTGRLANGTGVRLSNGANGNTIGGPTAAWRNVISGNKGNGIELVNPGTKNNTVTNNYIGVDATGSSALGNTWGSSASGAYYAGVSVDYPAAPNTIGKPGAGNVISGNFWGVELKSAGNVVAANYIGTDATGTTRISNAVGVEVAGQNAEHNTIGGTTAGARNVISGNSEAVQLFKSFFTTISGNYIGTDATGTVPLGNSEGVHISISGGNTIGGTTAGARNVISGNSGDAVYMVNGWGNGVDENRVVGNYIGTDVSGSVGVGNGGGVHIVAELYGNEYAAVCCNTIGGNVISANTGWAVLFDDSIPDAPHAGDFAYNSVSSNYIGTNAAGDAALPNGGGVKFVEGWYFHDNSIGGELDLGQHRLGRTAQCKHDVRQRLGSECHPRRHLRHRQLHRNQVGGEQGTPQRQRRRPIGGWRAARKHLVEQGRLQQRPGRERRRHAEHVRLQRRPRQHPRQLDVQQHRPGDRPRQRRQRPPGRPRNHLGDHERRVDHSRRHAGQRRIGHVPRRAVFQPQLRSLRRRGGQVPPRLRRHHHRRRRPRRLLDLGAGGAPRARRSPARPPTRPPATHPSSRAASRAHRRGWCPFVPKPRAQVRFLPGHSA